MKLLMENWRGYFEEADEEAAFDSFLDKAFNKLLSLFGEEAPAVEQEVEQKLNEVGILFGAGIALAAPAIVVMLATIAKIVGGTIKGWTGKDLGIEKVANKIIHYAHEAHTKFQLPIKLFIQKVLRIEDEKKATKYAGFIYNLLIAYLMVASGAGAAQAYSEGAKSLATIEGSLAVVKGGEVTSYLKAALGGKA